MSDPFLIRSYQRIFKPSRRIYRVEGHQIPVPGGIPLAWLAYYTGGLLSVLALTAGSLTLFVVLAVASGIYGRAVGGTTAALLAGVAVLVACVVLGATLALLDWPLRLLVLPGAVATLATQATPDGRPVHRYVRSWVALHLRPERRSLGRPLPRRAAVRPAIGAVWIARDQHCDVLRRGRIVGPATVIFRTPVTVTARGLRGRRSVARPAASSVGAQVDDVELGPNDRLEVRP